MKKLLAIAATVGVGILAYLAGKTNGVILGTSGTLRHIRKYFPECAEKIAKGPNIEISGDTLKYRFKSDKT